MVPGQRPSCPLSSVMYLESAEDGSHSAVQGVPAPVAFVDHGFELARSVSAVLSGQAAVLVVDQFQLGQPLMNLPLETLKRTKEDGMNHVIEKQNGITAPNIITSLVNTLLLFIPFACFSSSCV